MASMTNCKYCKADCCNKGLDHKLENGCRGYIPMTNGDIIRATTDEELAKFLMQLMGHTQCFAEGIFPYHPCPQNLNCIGCAVNWLQQPVKEPT